MRLVLLLIAALALTACTNQVHSQRPLFAARDSQGRAGRSLDAIGTP
jgi:hypothetical protein